MTDSVTVSFTVSVSFPVTVPGVCVISVIVSSSVFQKNSGISSSSVDNKNVLLLLMVRLSTDVNTPLGSVNASTNPSPSVSFA